jgi:hypothetical protein
MDRVRKECLRRKQRASDMGARLCDCFPSEAELLRFLRLRNGLYGPLTVPKTTAETAPG